MSDEQFADGLLVDFENKNIPGEYQVYYKTKRQNFFSSIERFRELWNLHLMLDQIIYREIDDLQVSIDTTTNFPQVFFINAHAKIRIAIELAFTGCMQEARSILRDAVEYTAYAHHMLKDSELQLIWLKKMDDPEAEKVYKKHFESFKKDNLFLGLDQLHEKYGELSEAGSHPTPIALAHRLAFQDTDTHRGMKVTYTGVEDAKFWEMEIFSRLMTAVEIEFVFFNNYNDRLKLDPKLAAMRREFNAYKENLRQQLIRKHTIPPPARTK